MLQILPPKLREVAANGFQEQLAKSNTIHCHWLTAKSLLRLIKD
jgi:hypothetical protein